MLAHLEIAPPKVRVAVTEMRIRGAISSFGFEVLDYEADTFTRDGRTVAVQDFPVDEWVELTYPKIRYRVGKAVGKK